MKANEYLEIKGYLSQLAAMINMLIPEKVSVSYIAESSGQSRQSVHKYLINNFEPEKDFWREGGKTYVSRQVAISMLQRNNTQKMAA